MSIGPNVKKLIGPNLIAPNIRVLIDPNLLIDLQSCLMHSLLLFVTNTPFNYQIFVIAKEHVFTSHDLIKCFKVLFNKLSVEVKEAVCPVLPKRLFISWDEVAEWLRRWTANPMCSAREGSNPFLVVVFCSWTFILWQTENASKDAMLVCVSAP